MKAPPLAAGLAALALSLAPARPTAAFCGFYVGGAEAKLFNNATQVVLLRDGLRTVLSMANAYQGPPEGFAMVVPVPVVLHEENVKTLPASIFDRVDRIGGPRLVEYWEEDPCPPPPRPPMKGGRGPFPIHYKAGDGGGPSGGSVRVEAEFVVGEYEIVILSASDSLGLDTWLRQSGYRIPAGAEPYLRPYVQQGMKFFVAKVDARKVHFEDGQAILSPLRFHYDSDQFFLPIRLGLINSAGSQDLIVNILARGQRYDVANYENVAIPTNIDVEGATRQRFPAFYTRLFEDTLKRHPRAVVTEYSWQATSCDPCPTSPLDPSELSTLGADLAGVYTSPSDFVLTRLHARYTKDVLGDDLFFRAAPPIVGGRELLTDGKTLERGAVPSGQNNFQARYAIRHPWTGPIKCAHPRRGIWGGPHGGGRPETTAAPRLGLQQAGDVQLASLVTGAVPPETLLATAGATPLLALPAPPPTVELDAGAEPPAADAGPPPGPPAEPPHGGCAGCTTSSAGGGALGALAAVMALGFARARRRPGRGAGR
jgi:hypothetical protein